MNFAIFDKKYNHSRVMLSLKKKKNVLYLTQQQAHGISTINNHVLLNHTKLASVVLNNF